MALQTSSPARSQWRPKLTGVLSVLTIAAAIYLSASLILVLSAGNPSVVVNKYFNSGAGSGVGDVVELLVIQNNLDMRGMIVKDFSASMANDGGGNYTFTNDALWSSVRSGTLIVLRTDNSAADVTVGGADYNLDVGMANTTYFTHGGATFDIATVEEVMIKAAGSATTGVVGSIHALAGGTAAAQFTATAVPKLIATGTSGTNFFVYANNSTQTINDFDGTDATGGATGLTFGAGNNANNTAYINSLRSAASPSPSPSPSPIPTPTPSLSISDVSQVEGNVGPTTFTFNVTLSQPADVGGVNFTVNTADGTATLADSDYVQILNGSGSIAQGLTSTTVMVQVNGDSTTEANETFFVNITNVTGAGVTDAQGQGTIVNDDGIGSSLVVISQVYGGGGNSGATYRNDFIELYNRGTTPVDLTGWSVQFALVTSSFGTASPATTNLSGIIQPGHYYLIQEAAGANVTTTVLLPTPDATGTIAVGSTGGKVALVSNTTLLSGNCPAFLANGIVDFVAYGAADCSETSPAPGTTNLVAAIRNNNGCTDTDNNSADFSVSNGPIPRNSSITNTCAGSGNLSGSGSANPNSIDPGSGTLLTVTVSPASGPTSTGITVTGNLTSIGGSATQQFYDDGTHGDVTNGDNVFSFFATSAANTTEGAKSLPISIADAQARNASAFITMSFTLPTCGVERWSVKVGTDPDAGLVNLTRATPVTLATMRGWPAPGSPPLNSRVAPYETTAWVIHGTLINYKKEDDVDYHLVIQDGAGNTVITEVPCPCCGIGSPFQPRMGVARTTFDNRLTATTFFQNPNIPVRITGVGFFDFLHGQTGVAPNGIELHTILDLTFPTQQIALTAAGSNVVTQAGDVNLRFANVTIAGNTTVDPIDPSTAGPALGGYSLVGPAFNITTLATSTGPYNICISVPYITDPAAFQNLKILHNELGALIDRTTGIDPVNKMVCGNSPTLSPFVVALGPGPTAEVTNLSGHIADADGRPVEGAAIRMSGTQNRLTITDAAGNYHFDGLDTNGFYNITPARANYAFSPASRSFSALGHHIEAAFNGSYTGTHENSLDTTEYFVRQQYLDFLGREPEEAGFTGWVNTINNCASGDTRCDRVHVSEMFFRSLEFQQRGYFLYRFYSTALGRKPDYAEFAPDLAGVNGFLTSDQLEAAKSAFVNNFTVRPAFMARYDSLNNAEYVNALMSTAGVHLAERQTMIDGLNTGAVTRAAVLRQIAESGEVYQKYYNQAFVVMEYFGYLQRDPDALYLNWIVVLDGNPADARHMVEGFVDAAEYRQRFSR